MEGGNCCAWGHSHRACLEGGWRCLTCWQLDHCLSWFMQQMTGKEKQCLQLCFPWNTALAQPASCLLVHYAFLKICAPHRSFWGAVDGTANSESWEGSLVWQTSSETNGKVPISFFFRPSLVGCWFFCRLRKSNFAYLMNQLRRDAEGIVESGK